MKRKVFITSAVLFIAAFVSIIAIADRGEGNLWWPFINDIPGGDKLGHLGLVGTLSLLCNLAFSTGAAARPSRPVTRTTLVLLALISAEELAQAFIPNRTCDFGDWLADLAGLAAGQIIAGRVFGRLFA